VVSSCWIWFPFIQLRDHLLMDMYVNAWLWCIETASINIWGTMELMSPWAHPLNGKIVSLCLEFSSLCRFLYYIINIYCNLSTIKSFRRELRFAMQESWDQCHI
jgi:hypothetical protein